MLKSILGNTRKEIECTLKGVNVYLSHASQIKAIELEDLHYTKLDFFHINISNSINSCIRKKYDLLLIPLCLLQNRCPKLRLRVNTLKCIFSTKQLAQLFVDIKHEYSL